ncbi:MAG: agarase [Verrucomicrobiota bacterium]
MEKMHFFLLGKARALINHSHFIIFGAWLSLGMVALQAAEIPKAANPFLIESKKKPHQEWKPQTTYTLRQLVGYTAQPDPDYSKYGGIAGTQFPAKGFFYTYKHNGRWWLVDPDGHLYIHKAVCCVSPDKGPSFKEAFDQKFGTDEVWADEATAALVDLGFNGTAAWSSNHLLRASKKPLPYTTKWSFMSSYAKEKGRAKMGEGNHKYTNEVMPVFDPEFKTFADEHAKQLIETKDDPYLIGHFSDNELPFRKNILERCLKLEPDSNEHKEAKRWLKEQGNSTPEMDKLTADEKEGFFAHYAASYYSVVSEAIKKYDPNHLYLGSRVIGVHRDETMMRTYGKFVDIMSMNWYGDWLLPAELMENWGKWADKPFIISEWYSKALDIPGLISDSGAGWLVRTQEERGHYYQNMILNLTARKNNVGWHWFRYTDNDPLNEKVDPSNRNSNKGIFGWDYEPYPELASAMKEVNDQAYRLIEFFDETSYESASAKK